RLLACEERVRKSTLLFLACTTAAALLLAGISWTPLYEPWFRAVWKLQGLADIHDFLAISRTDWLLCAARGVLLLLLVRNVATVRRPLWLVLLGVFVVIDLGSQVGDLAPRMPASFLQDPPAAARRFPRDREPFRVIDLAHWQKDSPAGVRYRSSGPDAYWIARNSLSP